MGQREGIANGVQYSGRLEDIKIRMEKKLS